MLNSVKKDNIWLVCFFLFLGSSCNEKPTLFATLPSSKTNITFENKVENKPLLSILYYLYFYNGGGVSIGDINNDGLPDIYFTANSKGHNKLYLNKGNFEFEDITDKAGVAGSSDWCTGVTMADVNGDGFLDMYVSAVSNVHGLKGHNELFINNGNGTFTESAAKYGLDFSGYTTQVAFFDYDHDGDLDCYVLNQSHHPHANIVDTSHRRTFDSASGGRLFRNDLNTPSKKFTDVSAQAGIFQSNLCYGLGISIGDLNNDGWDDVYIGNDFHENDYYYINNGNGTFTESGEKHFNHYSRFSMGNDMADYNNDGQLDLISVDMLPSDEKILKTYGSDENFDIYKVKLQLRGYQNQFSKNCLQQNNGNGTTFSETALISGVSATDWSWCPLFADFDNDGNKDLFISSGIVKRPVDLDYVRFVSDLHVKKGMDQTDKYDDEAINAMPDGSSHPYLYKGDGKISFTDVSDLWGTGKMKGYFNGAAYGDLNNDGHLDLVINRINGPAVILKNTAPRKNYLSISFKGNKGGNTFGVGCKAYVFQKGKLQYQQLMLTRGFMSSSDTRLHFGLDSLATVDSILVVWPDQMYQVVKNIKANRQINIIQNEATSVFNYKSFFPPAKEILQNISSEINCNWKHKENDFVDFNVQYLIPREESTRGPKIAVGDVNKDGLDDFFVCGSKGQPGALMIQTKDGKFKSTDENIFGKPAGSDDVDAVFFDANNDGYPDLYVVSGGNEYDDGNENLIDRLYMNDGKGHFKQTSNIPRLLFNKSSVAVADVNKDGFNDLLVTGLANAKKYGYPQSSYLLLNDGKGNFKVAPPSVINLKYLGMATSSTFIDINHDGWMDLVVTGEWMPLKVFINNNGIFKETDVPNSTGLWQSLYVTDLNGDGLPDLLAGNWGLNSKLAAGKNGPLKLYVKDFDKNGSVEQIMAYTVDGKEYTFLAKDELERALPVLKKAYLKYSDVAGKTVQYMFYDLFKDYLELKAETLGSSAFINDGKGNFVQHQLPSSLQLSPLFSFQRLENSSSFFAGGNFFGVIPYEGRYDASSLLYFSTDNKGEIPYSKVLDTKGEIRDLKWLSTLKYGKVLVAAKNNDSLAFYRVIK
ncbi:MAG: VCBS repeat-containing protein [Ginsengibacter sp.]